MGIYSGPITVAKLHVRGSPPRGFKKRYLEAIRLRAFRPLRPEDEDESRHGWCVAGNAFDTDLSDEAIFFGGYLNLGLRIDRWRIPVTLLKARCAEAEAAALHKLGQEQLSRKQKGELRVTVSAALRRKLLPTMRLVDLCWDLDAAELWFFSQSPQLHELLGALFEQTFGLELDVSGPYLAATRLGLDEPQLEALAALRPTPFHVPRT